MTPNAHTAAEILMRHLGLTRRTAVEVQDLYSRPLIPLVAQAGVTDGDRV
jgi:hypothetical protein